MKRALFKDQADKHSKDTLVVPNGAFSTFYQLIAMDWYGQSIPTGYAANPP
jgi:hypothetical protein